MCLYVFLSRVRVMVTVRVTVKVTVRVRGSCLKTGPARPGQVKIALDITAVDIDLFFSLQYR